MDRVPLSLDSTLEAAFAYLDAAGQEPDERIERLRAVSRWSFDCGGKQYVGGRRLDGIWDSLLLTSFSGQRQEGRDLDRASVTLDKLGDANERRICGCGSCLPLASLVPLPRYVHSISGITHHLAWHALADIFQPGDIAWNCRDCEEDPTCVQCEACFNLSDHEGHEVRSDVLLSCHVIPRRAMACPCMNLEAACFVLRV